MDKALIRCLDDLERRIDAEEEEHLQLNWRDFALGRHEGEVFQPRRTKKRPPQTWWPRTRLNATLEDFEIMALQQYRLCSDILEKGGGSLLSVRTNYGTGILPSLFGSRLFVMPREMETLPTVWAVSSDEIDRILGEGVPDIRKGMGERVFAMGTIFREIAATYPKIGRFIHIYHPDAQGPLDICELLWGSDLFYALLENPQRVHALMDIITQTYETFMNAWAEIVPFDPEVNCHWGMYIAGKLMLREDTSTNLSPELVKEFVLPYDQRLLDTFGGGAVHFCGRGAHIVDRLATLKGVTAFNLSQPEMNDMEIVLTHTVDRGINLIGVTPKAAENLVQSGRSLHGRVHVSDGTG